MGGRSGSDESHDGSRVQRRRSDRGTSERRPSVVRCRPTAGGCVHAQVRDGSASSNRRTVKSSRSCVFGRSLRDLREGDHLDPADGRAREAVLFYRLPESVAFPSAVLELREGVAVAMIFFRRLLLGLAIVALPTPRPTPAPLTPPVETFVVMLDSVVDGQRVSRRVRVTLEVEDHDTLGLVPRVVPLDLTVEITRRVVLSGGNCQTEQITEGGGMRLDWCAGPPVGGPPVEPTPTPPPGGRP